MRPRAAGGARHGQSLATSSIPFPMPFGELTGSRRKVALRSRWPAIRPGGLKAARWFPRLSVVGTTESSAVHIGERCIQADPPLATSQAGGARAGRRRSRRCRSARARAEARRGSAAPAAGGTGGGSSPVTSRSAGALGLAVVQPQPRPRPLPAQTERSVRAGDEPRVADYPPVPMDLGLQGRVALVTAASSGIGFGIAAGAGRRGRVRGGQLALARSASRRPPARSAPARTCSTRWTSTRPRAWSTRVEADLGPLVGARHQHRRPAGRRAARVQPRPVGGRLPRAGARRRWR